MSRQSARRLIRIGWLIHVFLTIFPRIAAAQTIETKLVITGSLSPQQALPVSCVSGSCQASESLKNGTLTDSGSASITPAANGFNVVNHGEARFLSNFTNTLDASSMNTGIFVQLFAKVAADAQLVLATTGNFQISWNGQDPGQTLTSIGFRDRCSSAGTSSSGGATNGSQTLTQPVSCVQAPGFNSGDFLLVNEVRIDGLAAVRAIGHPLDGAYDLNLMSSFKVRGKVMEKAGGDGQRHFVEQTLSQPLKVLVVDGLTGVRQAGVSIQFEIVSVPLGAKGQSLSSPSPTTDANGAAATDLTLGDAIGDYLVRALCTGCAANQQITFTGSAIPADSNMPNNPSLPPETSLPPGSGDSSGNSPAQVTFRPSSFDIQYTKTFDLCATVTPGSETGKVRFSSSDDLRIFFPATVAGCAGVNQIGIHVISRDDKCMATGEVDAIYAPTGQKLNQAVGNILIPEFVQSDLVRANGGIGDRPPFSTCSVFPGSPLTCVYDQYDIVVLGAVNMDITGLSALETVGDYGQIQFQGRTLPLCTTVNKVALDPKDISKVGSQFRIRSDFLGYTEIRPANRRWPRNCGNSSVQTIKIAGCYCKGIQHLKRLDNNQNILTNRSDFGKRVACSTQ